MTDLARIKRNVAKMAAMGAPEADIDGYIASEGVTIDDVRNFKPGASPGPMISVGGRKIPIADYQAMSNEERQAIRSQIAHANPTVQTQSDILDPFVQGITFGWGDEARGLVQGGLAALQGGDFESVRAQTEDEARAALEHERRVNPVGSFTAEVAGGLATGAGAGGQLAGRGATLLQRAALSGLVGAGQGAVYGAGAANGDMGERAAGAGLGAVVGGGAGAALPVIGNRLSQGLNRAAQGRILNQAAQGAPSATEMRTAASAMFDQATGGAPIAITDNAFFRFLGGVQNTANRFRINPNLDQRSVGLSQMMLDIADDLARPGTIVDLKDLHLLRQAAQRVAQSGEGRDTAFASAVINQLDDFIKTLKPSDIAGGADPSAATNALFSGISTWARANKVGLIEDAVARAKNQASGLENGLRIQFRRILNNPTQRRLFNAAEIQALEDVVQGTPISNIAKILGKFGFGTGNASNMLGGTIGFGAGSMTPLGPLGGLLAAGIGSAARKGSEVLTERAANRAIGAAATPNLRVLPPLVGSTSLERLFQRAGNPMVGSTFNR